MSDRLGAKDPRLSDAAWMRRAYAEHGDMWIALETGAARGTVRARRQRLGIESAPVGPRQGLALEAQSLAPLSLDATEQAITSRYRQAKQRRAPATETTLAAAIRAAHDARQANDANAYDSALVEIAAAAALIHDHRQQLRRAA